MVESGMPSGSNKGTSGKQERQAQFFHSLAAREPGCLWPQDSVCLLGNCTEFERLNGIQGSENG